MKKAHQGIDGIEIAVELDGQDAQINLPKQSIKSPEGFEYGSIEAKDGKAKIKLCLPHYFRSNNINPVTQKELRRVGEVLSDIEKHFHSHIGKIGYCRLTNIECNITLELFGECMPHYAMDLVNRAYSETTNMLFVRAARKCKQQKEASSLSISKKNYYILKLYNKTIEQKNRRNFEIEENLLRFEIVMIGRTVKKLFGEACTLRDVLKAQNLIKVMKEYKRIFIEDVIQEHVKPCLDNITRVLFESLTQTDSPTKTLANYREIVVDEEVFRRALKRWYGFRGMPDNSRQTIRALRKYDLPRDVLKAIKSFREACG